MALVHIINDKLEVVGNVDSKMTSTCVEQKKTGEKIFAFRFNNAQVTFSREELSDFLSTAGNMIQDDLDDWDEEDEFEINE